MNQLHTSRGSFTPQKGCEAVVGLEPDVLVSLVSLAVLFKKLSVNKQSTSSLRDIFTNLSICPPRVMSLGTIWFDEN